MSNYISLASHKHTAHPHKVGKARRINVLYFCGYTTIKVTKNDGIEDISTVDFISSEIKHIYTKRTTIVSEE